MLLESRRCYFPRENINKNMDSNGNVAIERFTAKNFKNAERNAKKFCKDLNFIFYGPDPDHYNTPNNYYKTKEVDLNV